MATESKIKTFTLWKPNPDPPIRKPSSSTSAFTVPFFRQPVDKEIEFPEKFGFLKELLKGNDTEEVFEELKSIELGDL